MKEKNNNYLPQVTKALEANGDSFLNLFLSPLQNQIPIGAQEKDLCNFPDKLNRHEIIHGVNTTYGSKINALKTISLLKYMSDLLMELEKH